MTLFAAECHDARQSPRHEFRGRSRQITLKASTPELAHATTLPPSGAIASRVWQQLGAYDTLLLGYRGIRRLLTVTVWGDKRFTNNPNDRASASAATHKLDKAD